MKVDKLNQYNPFLSSVLIYTNKLKNILIDLHFFPSKSN